MSHKIKQTQQTIIEKVPYKYCAKEICEQMRADLKRAAKNEKR